MEWLTYHAFFLGVLLALAGMSVIAIYQGIVTYYWRRRALKAEGGLRRLGALMDAYQGRDPTTGEPIDFEETGK